MLACSCRSVIFSRAATVTSLPFFCALFGKRHNTHTRMAAVVQYRVVCMHLMILALCYCEKGEADALSFFAVNALVPRSET